MNAICPPPSSPVTFLHSGLKLSANGTPAASRPTLEARIVAPFVVNSTVREDVIDYLFWQIEQVLTSGDSDFRLLQVRNHDDSSSTPLLTVTLLYWRATEGGEVECRFSADYRDDNGSRPLGLFEGRTAWLPCTRGFASREFERAAEEASYELRDALHAHGVL